MSDFLQTKIRNALTRYDYTEIEHNGAVLYGIYTREDVGESGHPTKFLSVCQDADEAEAQIETIMIEEIISIVRADSPPPAPAPSLPPIEPDPPRWPPRPYPAPPYPFAPDILCQPSTTCGFTASGAYVQGVVDIKTAEPSLVALAGDDLDVITSGPFEGMTEGEARNLLRQGT